MKRANTFNVGDIDGLGARDAVPCRSTRSDPLAFGEAVGARIDQHSIALPSGTVGAIAAVVKRSDDSTGCKPERS